MIWKETPLSKFGFKCVMNKHRVCVYTVCECLCHEVTYGFSQKKEEFSLSH